jgi:hypothetical protein
LTERPASSKTKLGWRIHAYYLDACNCDWGCPCQFNAKPTHGNCDGVSGIHIIDGTYGNDIKLDGLDMAFIVSWPGPIHEGHGKACYYIDDRCNDKQFEVLSDIITGRDGGNAPFSIYASIIEEYDEPKRARIKFQPRDIRSAMTIHSSDDDIIDTLLEPIRNPVTGKIHRAIIELPEGFEATRMDQASTKTLSVNTNRLKFRYEGTYGSFSEIVWKSS